MADLVERYSTTINIYSEKRVAPKLSAAYLAFKIILLISNLIFMIFACVLMGVGSWALNNQATVLAGQTLPSGLIAMGVFMLFLSALGAISAWKESVPGLGFYLAFLLMITIILFSIGVAVSVKKASAGEYIAEAWYRAPADVRGPIQTELECCGLTYWNDSAVWPCPPAANFSGGAYCYPQLVSAFESAWQHAGGTGIAFSVLMGAGIFLVACLIQGIKRRKHEQDLDLIRDGHAAAGGDGAAGGGAMGAMGGMRGEGDIDAGAASMFDKADDAEHEHAHAHAGPVVGRR